MSTLTPTIRQGLPRHPGGEPWPPLTAVPAGIAVPAPVAAPAETAVDAPVAPTGPTAPVPQVEAPAATPSPARSTGFARADLRQGLPRIPGGEPWPPRTETAAEAVAPAAAPAPVPTIAAAASAPPAPGAAAAPVKPTPQRPATPAAPAKTKEKAEPRRLGPLTIRQWIVAVVLGAFCALGMATALVLATRWFLGFEAVSDFVTRYPGEYHLPESAPVGIPGWMGWQHFFNLFLMVLIIRSGLQVRRQQKPPAYFSSKRSPKVSINLWLHQCLDVLWLVNGLIFIILLFVTGHWMRIVPTSWEVFPNAISAALQYMSLDWPTDNGWVNYNSLQQLAYFGTVFIAAPLAAVTGYRMSAFWPKQAATLNRIYPVEVARKLHFPVMLYFVVFIFIHVALVFATGALRNLNHMYAAQGSVDPTEFAANWTGFWLFAASLLVIGVAWAVCRPMLLVPVARLFGTVSSR